MNRAVTYIYITNRYCILYLIRPTNDTQTIKRGQLNANMELSKVHDDLQNASGLSNARQSAGVAG